MTERGVDLTTIEQFLNTLDERTFVRLGSTHAPADGLTSTGELAAWLRSHELPADVGADDLTTARALRAGARAALLADEPALDILEQFPLRLRSDAGLLRLTADTGSAGLDLLVETVATAVADSSWRRLKLCASQDCHWAFVDTSRSGGGRWCSMETCGNRHKTRAYRRRQNADAPGRRTTTHASRRP